MTPNCRYGHGDLVRQPDLWALDGMRNVKHLSPTQVIAEKLDHQFVVSLFTCQKCGYVELFDDEDAT